MDGVISEEKICCFTGHREFERMATHQERLLLEKLIDNLIGYGYTTFITGGALGFDTVAAEYVVKCRSQGVPIRLNMVIPCRDQDRRWSLAQQQRYRNILGTADHVEILHETYVDGCMHERNRRMVERSVACVAFCNRPTGGTASTVRYAQARGLIVYNIVDMIKQIKWDGSAPNMLDFE